MARGYMPGNNMQNLMRQAQKAQKEMEAAQAKLAETEFTASAGGGAVTVVVMGDRKVKSVKIQPDAVDAEDVEMLEDLVLAAVKEALANAQALASEKMGRATGGMNLPGMGMF